MSMMDKGRVIYQGKRGSQFSYPGRYSEGQWKETNSLAHKASQTQRQDVERILAEGFRVADEVEEVRTWNAGNVEWAFKRRIRDVKHWIEELDAKFNEISGVIDDAGVIIRRLEGSLEGIPPIVALDKEVLERREHRVGIDLVNDEPQKNVLKELQLLEDVRVEAERLLAAARENLRVLRKFQFDLNKELLDKKDAMRIDTEAHQLAEHSSGVKRQGTLNRSHVRDEEEWESITTRYKITADKLLKDSTSFRAKVDSFLRLSCEQLDKQVCDTNAAFEKRLWEIRHAKEKLETEHADVTLKIREMEDVLDKLKKCYVEKESSLALAETRLAVRSRRPNLELVNDIVQRNLRIEVQELKMAMDKVQAQIQQTKLAFHRMQAHQVMLEEGINVKINSIAIDETIVMPIRKQICVKMN